MGGLSLPDFQPSWLDLHVPPSAQRSRLSNSVRSAPCLAYASLLIQCAVKQFTKIPVPDVLASSSQNDNPIGTEYIIMNEIQGVLLKDVWNTMTASQHIKCIESIAHLVKELCAVNIPYFGSLYSSTDEQDGLLALGRHYGIGPLCKAHYHVNEVVQTGDSSDSTQGRFGPCALHPYLRYKHDADSTQGRA
jgi:hypothetical protein